MFTLAICRVADKNEHATNVFLLTLGKSLPALPQHGRQHSLGQVKKRGPNYLHHPSHYYLGSRAPWDISTGERLTHHRGWFLAARWVSQFLRASFFWAKEGEKSPTKQKQSFHFRGSSAHKKTNKCLLNLFALFI